MKRGSCGTGLVDLVAECLDIVPLLLLPFLVAACTPVDKDVVHVGDLEERDSEEEADVAADLGHHREDGIEEVLCSSLDVPVQQEEEAKAMHF